MAGMVSTAPASTYDWSIPPGPETCVGVLAGGENGLHLTTENRTGKFDYHTDIVCGTADIAVAHPLKGMLGPKTIKQVLKVCKIGEVCIFNGMMQGLFID